MVSGFNFLVDFYVGDLVNLIIVRGFGFVLGGDKFESGVVYGVFGYLFN